LTERRQDTVALFTQALNVVNGALAKHQNTTPYKQILAASRKALGERRVGVAVYADDPGQPFDFFTVRFREGRLELVDHGKREPELTWKVSRSYLDEITRDPETYVENPAKLDWEWLKSRVGIA
jgi:hypothetical protein